MDGVCARCLLSPGLPQFPAREPADSLVSGVLGPGYRLIEKIGAGGLGEVFLAEQLAPVRREVAVKRLKSDHDSREWLRRFQHGLEALAQLDHPNIALVFDAGMGLDGRPFCAMELVEGVPITEFCDREKCGLDDRLALFVSVCEAVRHAHQKGVWHGDLKPSNILVGKDESGRGVPKLIDFGCASWASSGMTFNERAAPAPRFGTPGYASPEQHGGARPPDSRSDVFSLGMVLRELLTRHPRALAGEAGWIVDRATRSIPEERYDSAATLVMDVQALRECRPLSAQASNPWYLARKFVHRERRWLAITGMVLLLTAVGGAILAKQVWQTRRAQNATRIARRVADTEFHRAQLTEELVHGLAQVLREPDLAQRSERVRVLLERLGERADALALEDSPDAAFSLHLALGAAAHGVGRLRDAERHFLAGRQLAAQLDGPRHRRRGVEGALAKVYFADRRYAEAEVLLRRMVATSSVSDSPHARVEPLLDLTRVLLATRQHREAEITARRAVASAREAPDPRNPLVLSALYYLTETLVEQRRYLEALKPLREAAAGFRERFGPRASETREANTLLAEVEQVLRDQESLPPGASPRASRD